MNRTRCWPLVFMLLLIAACTPGAPSAWLGTGAHALPTPTPLPTAIIPEKPTYTVQRGAVVDSLTFTGRVSPVEEAELYFRTDGRVLQLYVERGDTVQAGDKLAELNVEALHRQLAQGELALATAQTDLETAEAQRAHELARARLNLDLEQIALQKLQAYDPAADLAVAEAELEQVAVDLHQAQSRYDAIATRPDIGMRPEAAALQHATLAYALAQAVHDRAVKQAGQHTYDIQSQQKRVELARLEAGRLDAGVAPQLVQVVTKAQLDLADLQAQITDTLILAPFDGKVVATNTAAGKVVEGFRPVLVVVNPAELEVTAELTDAQMRRLSEGQALTIVPVEYPGQKLPGSITTSNREAGRRHYTHRYARLASGPVRRPRLSPARWHYRRPWPVVEGQELKSSHMKLVGDA